MKDAGLGLVIVLVIAVVMVGAIWEFDSSYQQVRRAWADQSIAQAKADTARYLVDQAIATEHDQAVEPVRIAFEITLLTALSAAAILAVFIAADQYRLRRAPLVRFDQAGLLPISRLALESGNHDDMIAQLAAGAMQARIAAASVQPVPAQLTYSPHLAVKTQNALQPSPLPAGPDESSIAMPSAPTWAELVTSGWRASPDRMLLGYGVDGPVYSRLDELLSTVAIGRPKTGKSSLLRFVFAQALQVGCAVVIFDPHGSVSESIPAGGNVVACAGTAETLDTAAAWLNTEIDKRLASYLAGKREFDPPILVLVDEFPRAAALSRATADVFTRVILEARKVAVFGLVSGQGLPASLFPNGTLARDSLSSRFCFRTSTRQASMIGLEKGDLGMVIDLPCGRAVLDGEAVDKAQIVAIPLTTGRDLEALKKIGPGDDLEGDLSTYDAAPGTYTTEPLSGALSGSVSGPLGDLDDTDRAIWHMIDAGASKTRIIRDVFSCTSGPRFKDYSARVDAVREKYLTRLQPGADRVQSA